MLTIHILFSVTVLLKSETILYLHHVGLDNLYSLHL